MGTFVRTESLWEAEYGQRPTGFSAEKDRYGKFEGRATYLSLCPCGNCPRLVAVYADDLSVCRKQSAGLDRQLQALLAQFMKLRDERVKIERYRNELEITLLPESQVFGIYRTVAEAYAEAWLQEVEVLRVLASSGLLEVNQDEVKILEHITEDLCPFFAILRTEDQTSRPALMSGQVEAKPEAEPNSLQSLRQLVADTNVFLDDALGMDEAAFELLDKLFSQKRYTDDDLDT